MSVDTADTVAKVPASTASHPLHVTWRATRSPGHRTIRAIRPGLCRQRSCLKICGHRGIPGIAEIWAAGIKPLAGRCKAIQSLGRSGSQGLCEDAKRIEREYFNHPSGSATTSAAQQIPAQLGNGLGNVPPKSRKPV